MTGTARSRWAQEQEAERQARRVAGREQVRKVACPTCDAPAGTHCRNGGRSPRITNHRPRVEAAIAAGVYAKAERW